MRFQPTKKRRGFFKSSPGWNILPLLFGIKRSLAKKIYTLVFFNKHRNVPALIESWFSSDLMGHQRVRIPCGVAAYAHLDLLYSNNASYHGCETQGDRGWRGRQCIFLDGLRRENQLVEIFLKLLLQGKEEKNIEEIGTKMPGKKKLLHFQT